MCIGIHPSTAQILAYGDSFGLPYETRTNQDIIELGGVPPYLMEPYAHTDFDDFLGMPAGTWSDDTQHALVVCEALERQDGYSLSAIALGLKDEMRRSKGWGKTTKRAIERVDSGMTNDRLANNGEVLGNGCGPLMRSVPLAVYAVSRQPELLVKMAYESAGLTHNNPENIAATVTHHRLLAHLINHHGTCGDISDIAYKIARKEEKKYGARPYLSDAIKRARKADNVADAVYTGEKWGAFTTWAVQAVSYEMFGRLGAGSLIDLLVGTVSEGGDADSTGAVVAGMWALSRCNGELPADIYKLEDQNRLEKSNRWMSSLFETCFIGADHLLMTK